MNLQDFLVILRAAQKGLKAMEDEIVLQTSGFGTPEAPTVSQELVDAAVLDPDTATRKEVLRALALLAPGAKLDEHEELDALRVRLADAQVAARERANVKVLKMDRRERRLPDTEAGYMPPGIDASPSAIERAKRLTVFFDEHRADPNVVAHLMETSCDQLCLRTEAGACPATELCEEAFDRTKRVGRIGGRSHGELAEAWDDAGEAADAATEETR